MIIVKFLMYIIFIFSYEKDSSIINSIDHQLTKKRLKSTYIQLIPSKGICLNTDSILIGTTSIIDLLQIIDTNSIKWKLTFNNPEQIVLIHIGSPPPDFTGQYVPQPDDLVTNYSATVQFDSLTFLFSYSSINNKILDQSSSLDILKIKTITISKPLNAGLYDDLKIGDNYEQIFKHFKKSVHFNELNEIQKEYKFIGIIFIIETNRSKVDTYGKIIKIEINN